MRIFNKQINYIVLELYRTADSKHKRKNEYDKEVANELIQSVEKFVNNVEGLDFSMEIRRHLLTFQRYCIIDSKFDESKAILFLKDTTIQEIKDMSELDISEFAETLYKNYIVPMKKIGWTSPVDYMKSMIEGATDESKIDMDLFQKLTVICMSDKE